MLVYCVPNREAHALLGVDPAIGPRLLGPALVLEPLPAEDPVSYTVRWLEQIVACANDLLAGRLPGGSGRSPAVGSRADGPQSHRPKSRPRPQRRYVALARAVAYEETRDGGPDRARYLHEEQESAEAASLSEVLTELGKQLESGAVDLGADELVVTVSWEDEDER